MTRHGPAHPGSKISWWKYLVGGVVGAVVVAGARVVAVTRVAVLVLLLQAAPRATKTMIARVP